MADPLSAPTERPLRRAWYWPPWQLSAPWKIYVFRGGDEYDRTTLAFHLGPLGCIIVATGSPGSVNWRCECGDLNVGSEAFCYRCGVGQPEDEDA